MILALATQAEHEKPPNRDIGSRGTSLYYLAAQSVAVGNLKEKLLHLI